MIANGHVVIPNEGLERITVTAGGFARIGGVETLVHSLVLALHARRLSSEVICWGAQNPLLVDLQAVGASVLRTRFQWGCRWGLPDRLMFALRRRELGNATLIVYPKLLRPEFHIAERRLNRRNQRSNTILITPYRPSEMWAASPPSPQLLECFDAIITQSAAFEADLREFGYEGVVSQLPLIPPVCEPVAPSPACSTKIGFLGRMVDDKRLDYLLDAVASIPQSANIRLELFGEGPLETQLKEHATRLGLASRVRFNGPVERSQVKAAIDSCTLFAFSSRTEGQCLAAIEILSRGRPIVATRVGVFPELLADGNLGRLAPSNDPRRFGELLVELATEVSGNASFTPQAVQDSYARRVVNSDVVDRYIELFRRIGSTHGADQGIQ
jgi:glycosyltransferase involved in cell wall biosynthesis